MHSRLVPTLLTLTLVCAALPAGAKPAYVVVDAGAQSHIYTFDAAGKPVGHAVVDGLEALPESLRSAAGTPTWVYVRPAATHDLGPSPSTRLAELAKDIGAAGAKVRTVQVLRPRDEAAFAWYGVNWARGTLDEPVGILNMNGDTLTFAFVPEEGAPHTKLFLAGEREFELYATTYGGLATIGSNDDPGCYPQGVSVHAGGGVYLPGAGEVHQCRKAVFSTLATMCKAPPCSLMGTPQPPVTGSFLAWGDFPVDAAQKPDTRLTPESFMDAAQRSCTTTWNHDWLPHPDRYVSPLTCHEHTLMATLLRDGLGFRGNSKRITWTDLTGDTPWWARGVVAARGLPN